MKATQKAILAKLKTSDLDGDGVFDREEFKNLLQELGETDEANLLFDQLDVDKSGFLEKNEIKTFTKMKVMEARNSTTAQLVKLPPLQ